VKEKNIMTRFQQILVVILAVQIALGVFVFWPRSAAQETGGPLLPDFIAADVISLTIHDGDGNHVALARDGDDWILADSGSYPALGDKILPLLEKIEGVQTNRLVTQTDASHKRLKVAADDFNRLLEMTLQDGTTHKFYLGTSAGANATHVRVDDQSEVYLAGELNAWEADTQASAWLDTLYFTVPQTATVALTLENEQGTFEFERDGEIWTMKGLTEDETFAENNLTTVLNQITSLRMTRPLGKEEKPSFGLDNPKAVVTLKTEDGKAYTLRVGAQDEDDRSYVVKWSESPYYVKVGEFTAKEVVERGRDDFLLPPPTSESESDSTNQSE
jgi:YD repeat-containing protein